MVFDVSEVTGIGEYTEAKEILGNGNDTEKVTVYKMLPDPTEEPRAFLVVRKNTIEVRTDSKLRDLLREKYESVMESRYFGKGGIEIVNSGQLAEDEIDDLIRLSYNLTAE